MCSRPDTGPGARRALGAGPGERRLASGRGGAAPKGRRTVNSLEDRLLDPSQIFRQVALDRLASPERLDTLLGFPFPRLWLILLGGGALAIALALWWLIGSGGSVRALVVG